MATFAQIKEVRLAIDDPAGFIDFLSVDTLPSAGSALAQRAYYLTADQSYHTAESGALVVASLRVADSSLTEWIDAYGVDKAKQRGYTAIMQKLGNEMMIVRNSDGAESTEFVKLLDLYNFYKALKVDTAEAAPANPSGRYLSTKRPCVAGGNL